MACMAFAALLPGAGAASTGPDPLFAGTDTIRLTLRGPITAIARSAERSTDEHDASLTLEGPVPETHPIRLSARGLTRRKRDVCTFPPLRIDFAGKPAATSFFKGQNRLKLVTHCQPASSFRKHLLLEYAAYRLFNVLTPLSFRVRLARIDYIDTARGFALSRLAFLIEDIDDTARRNGLREAATGDKIPLSRLAPRDAARFAVFQYMIGNLDWAMDAGPPGDGCCHNARLVGAARDAPAGLVPIPYDFDFSGLVDAPYAVPPDQVPVASVRHRRYRGYCAHNGEALAAAAEMRAARVRLEAVLDGIAELDERTRDRASAYLAAFFEDIGSAEDVSAKLLGTCLR